MTGAKAIRVRFPLLLIPIVVAILVVALAGRAWAQQQPDLAANLALVIDENADPERRLAAIQRILELFGRTKPEDEEEYQLYGNFQVELGNIYQERRLGDRADGARLFLAGKDGAADHPMEVAAFLDHLLHRAQVGGDGVERLLLMGELEERGGVAIGETGNTGGFG